MPLDPTRIDLEAAGYAMVDAARLLRLEFERRIQDANLPITPGEARLLMRVARCGGPIRQHELASMLDISRMALTNYIDRLEGSGLLERVPCGEDRRSKHVRLTDEARPVVDQIAAIGRASRETARGAIGEDDWRQFVATLAQVRDNLSAARSPEREQGA